MNKRNVGGFDLLIKQAFQSFLQSQKHEISAEAGGDEQDFSNQMGLHRKGPKYAERKKEVEKAKSL